MGAFLSGLAGIGKKALGMAGDAEPAGRFGRTMGGLSQGLGSLSNAMLEQPDPSQPFKRIPRPSPAQNAKSLPLGTSPVGSLSSVPYSSPDFAAGTGGGFAT